MHNFTPVIGTMTCRTSLKDTTNAFLACSSPLAFTIVRARKTHAVRPEIRDFTAKKERNNTRTGEKLALKGVYFLTVRLLQPYVAAFD